LSLFSSANKRSTPSHRRIREAWAFDWQSHGDSAVLNQNILRSGPASTISDVEAPSAYAWAEAIAKFIQSPRMQKRRVVCIGHSAGAAAMYALLDLLTCLSST
jgi:pimeloyl-ACP methyl ester carboxylesterase